VPTIAASLGVPIAALLVDDAQGPCIAEVWVSPETLREVKRESRGCALEVSERLSRRLEPAIWEAATGRLPRAQDAPARAKPRRSRAQVLTGIHAADEARTRARLVHLESGLQAIAAEPLDEPQP
jgi:hypothetical protein